MGTSRALRGPTGAGWNRARAAGRTWLAKQDDDRPEVLPDVAPFAEACRRALADDLRADPDRYGLRPALLAAGERLVGALDLLHRDGPRALLRAEGPVADDPVDALYVAFIDRVAGSRMLVTDTAVRRAAARCADRLTGADGPVATALRGDDGRSGSINGELFCAIYTLFFGEVVGEFLKTMIATKVQLAVPLLPVLPFGAGADVAVWIAERVASLIPNPCEEKEKPGNEEHSLAALGQDLLGTAIRRSLGLEDPHTPETSIADAVAEAVR